MGPGKGKGKKIRLLSQVPKHSEALQISQETKEVEDQLNEKLIVLVQSLQKLEKQSGIIIANNDYRKSMEDHIHSSIEQIYRIAATYVSEFSGQPYYTTRTDVNEIQRLCNDYSSLLFARLQRNTFADISDKKAVIRPDYIVKFTTANMTVQTMRQAIITKSQNMLTPFTVTTAALGDNNTDTDTEIVYVWVTSQDDKVCPICSRYEGQAWSFNDVDSIPDIPDDTHPNCRCIIQLSEAEVI